MAPSIRENHDAIRQAWKSRKRTIRLQVGAETFDFNLTRQDKQVQFVSGGQPVKRTESWIIAKRADGGLVPRISTSLLPGGNLRSAVSVRS